jgi:hypothetical protein
MISPYPLLSFPDRSFSIFYQRFAIPHFFGYIKHAPFALVLVSMLREQRPLPNRVIPVSCLEALEVFLICNYFGFRGHLLITSNHPLIVGQFRLCK